MSLSFLASLFAGSVAHAQGSKEVHALRSELAALRKVVEQLQRRVDQQDQQLVQIRSGAVAPTQTALAPAAPSPAGEKSPEQLELERQLAQELGAAPQGPALAPPTAAATGGSGASGQPIQILGGGSKNYLNLSFDVLVAGGASTTSDVRGLESGDHDPVQRGFTVQNVELVLDGAVDPYFKGAGNIVLKIDEDGETTIELEEAYLTSTSLPNNMQIKAGQFFSEFGRLNTQHPHSWDFVDQPLVNGRFLGGDGLRGPGTRLSWLAPTPFYSELFLGVQNANGETASSFENTPGELAFGREVGERPTGGLVWVPRYTASFDLSETQTLVMGASGAFGPNFTGGDADTRIYGADFFWKWKSPTAEAGFPYVKWQTELMSRRFEARATAIDTDGDAVADTVLPEDNLRDWGAYSQLVWGISRGWTLGLRGDYVDGDGSDVDLDPSTRGTRWRLSPALTWAPTEFSKFRLQFNHDDRTGLGSDESVFLQMEFLLGAHGAHKF